MKKRNRSMLNALLNRKLTRSEVERIISKDPRVESADWDEPGKAIVYLTEGYTWCALDGNRSVEGFNLADNQWEDPDPVGYLLDRLDSVEKIRE